MAYNLRLIRQCAEFQPLDHFKKVPRGTRGIYALLEKKKTQRGDKFDVVYVGMSGTGIRARLREHANRKSGWTHFSVYAVWPNINEPEIRELEGLFRAIYRKDTRANKMQVQKGFVQLKWIRDNSFDWK